MNKIRKYLIHLLGGVTEEELNWSIKYAVRRTGASVADAILLFMKNCNGLHADEWCKKVYGNTCKIHERAAKKLEEFPCDGNNDNNDFNDYNKGKQLTTEPEAWIARDKDGRLFLYPRKPEKNVVQWTLPDIGFDFIRLGRESFPEIQWSDDEPTRVSITIKK